eukprot:13688-Heterococcus_DN1.PRE.1
MLRCGLCLMAAASPRLANAFMPAALNARAAARYTQHLAGKLIDSEYGEVPEVDSSRVAVLFDFDGTIGDTETPAMEVAFWELAPYLHDGIGSCLAALIDTRLLCLMHSYDETLHERVLRMARTTLWTRAAEIVCLL